jgi:pimeloyl-ACP methyl ester carboxylesterase
MPHFSEHGLNGFYSEVGQGEALLLLHAGGTSSTHWRRVAPHLQSRYRLLAPDLIGFGETEGWKGPEELTHDHQADLMRALVVQEEVPIHVVGHSYGGATAVRLAVRYPELVKSLVLIEPVLLALLREAGETRIHAETCKLATDFLVNAEAGREVTAWRRFIDHHNGDGTWEGLSGNARQRFLERTKSNADGFRSNLNDVTSIADIGNLDIPVSVVCGSKTSEAFLRTCDILRDELSDGRYTHLAGAGHMSPLTHPEAVADAVLAHLARWERGNGGRAGRPFDCCRTA